MGYYDEDVATALELIEEAGVQCVWKKQSTTLDDADRPWLGGDDDPDSYDPFIAFIPATDTSSGFGLTKFRQGEDVRDFSTFGLMGAQDFTPEVTDTLLRGGVAQTIVAVDEIKPADQVVLYILSIE